MTTQEQVMESLDTVLVPGVVRSVVRMNLVREVNVTDHNVDVAVASAALAPAAQEWLKDKIKDVTGKATGVKEINVSFVDSKPKDLNEISHIIAIMSGK